jgi:hypothetical protein
MIKADCAFSGVDDLTCHFAGIVDIRSEIGINYVTDLSIIDEGGDEIEKEIISSVTCDIAGSLHDAHVCAVCFRYGCKP